ncbi:RHS repeat-associated core domain-containing protein [Pseudofrankia sp. BMG5.37]|nr:RHS repeat-associated core domain-containing protein [Pseudofrankia sp. BMG5.37]MDT3443840.1 RHS repeat-associated core domain-containing protein [Pseudofrankia sp. BMG5.37]
MVRTGSGDLGGSSFTYDEDGRISQRADGSTWSNYHYDARGQLSAVDGGATGGTRVYDYDDAGQLSSVDYHGGTGAVRSFDYDQLGRVTSDTLTGPSGTLRAQSYAYDDNDNLTSTTISGSGVAGAGTQSYGYDWANRLTSWTNQASVTTSYGWDGAGNRTSAGGTSATYDARNRLASSGSTSYAYTARGTLSTKTTGSNVTTTVFDAFDRLVSHTAGTTTTSYTYDGLDRIATRTHGGAYNFLYNGVEKEPATDGTSAFARGPDGALIGAGTGSGDWVTLDNAHGDVVAAFTTDGASVTESRSYDPFGQPSAPASPDLAVGFQGSWTDPDTDLVAAQARWYDPGTGMFLSRDTFALPWTGTAADNRYTYAGANPLTHSDVTGLRASTDAEIRQSVAENNAAKHVTDSRCNDRGVCTSKTAQAAAAAVSALSTDQWAGIAAYVAYKNAYTAKYPGLPAKAYDEMIALGENGDQKWIAGVNAYNAMNAAKLAVLDTVRLTEQWDREQNAAAAVRANTAAVLDTVRLTEQWDQQQRAVATSNTTTPAQLDQYAKTLGTAPAASGNRQVCGTYAGSNQCIREYDLPKWLFELGWGSCDFGKYSHCDDQDPNHFSKYYKAWSDRDCHGALQCGAVIAASVVVPIPGAGGVGVGQDLAAAGKLLIRGGKGGAAAARAGEGAAARGGAGGGEAVAAAPGSVVNAVGGKNNCVSCAIAGDSTLRGSPASAIKRDPDLPFENGLQSIVNYAGRNMYPVSGVVRSRGSCCGPGTVLVALSMGRDRMVRRMSGTLWCRMVRSTSLTSRVDVERTGMDTPGSHS